MGILSGLFRSRDAPKDSTAGSAYRFLWAAAVPANVMKLLTLTYKYSLVKK